MKSQERYLDSLARLSKEDLVKFLPNALLKDLEGVESLVPSYKVFNAALLFLDVTGFSNIANKLQTETNEGSDLLTTHLNAYFSLIIDVVKKYHGDIILFSGDALLVMWNESDVEVACLQAVACGMALLQDASGYQFAVKTTSGEDITLAMSLHIGGAFGEVMSAVIGGKGAPSEGRWKYVLVGSTIEELGVAANMGTAGMFVITTDMFKNVPALVLTSNQLHGSIDDIYVTFYHLTSLEPTSVPDSVLQTTLPSLDTEKINFSIASQFTFDTLIHSAAHHSKGQLRTVSTVFIKLRSIKVDTDYPELHRKINKSVQIVQKALSRLGGILNKVIMDDKGIILVCLFGIPHHTHEDDAERSVLFGLKVSKKLSRGLGETSVGVAKANVFCGMSGCTARYEYTVLGDGVNLAARLMTKCESFTKKRHVICDGLTAAAVSSSLKVCGQVTFHSAGELELKGLSKPIASFHVLNATDAEAFSKKLGSKGSLIGGSTDSGSRPSRSSSKSSVSSFGSLFSRGSVSSIYSMHSRASNGSRASHLGRIPRTPHNNRAHVGLRSNHSVTSESHSMTFSRRNSDVDFKGQKEQLVCRKSELTKLVSFCDSVIKGKGRKLCCIKGTTQTGKTSFLRRADEYLTEHNIQTYLLVGNESRSSPFEALKIAVTRILEIEFVEPPMGCDSIDLSWLSYVVRDSRLGIPAEEQMSLPSRQKLVHVCELICTMMKRQEKQDRPIVLLVDDIQYVDSETQSFLLHVKKQEHMKIIFTSNGEKDVKGTHAELAADLDKKSTSTASEGELQSFDVPMTEEQMYDMQKLMKGEEVIVLKPFTEKQNYTLLTYLFNSEVERKLLNTIFQKTNGVPGYAFQVATHLMEHSLVTYQYGQMMLKDDYPLSESAVRFVNGFDAKVMRVMDTLSQNVKECLYLCSALGSSFEKSFIFTCYDKEKSEEEVDQMIEGMKSTGLLTVVNDTLRFVIPLTKDAIYTSMVKQDKQKVHETISKVVTRISAHPARDTFRHLAFIEEEIPFSMCSAALKEALREGDLIGSLAYIKHMKTYNDLSETEKVFFKLNAAVVYSEVGDYAASSEALAYLKTKFNVKQPSKKSRWLACCSPQTADTLTEEDPLAATVLWKQVEVAFMNGKKAAYVEAWETYKSCVPPSPEVAGRDMVYQFVTDAMPVISRTNVNKACPIAGTLIFGLRTVAQVCKTEPAPLNDKLDTVPFEDTTLQVYNGALSAAGVNRSMQAITLFLKGDHTNSETVINSIRDLPSQRWSLIGHLLKTLLSRYYQLEVPFLERRNEVASAWASESEILSPMKVNYDCFLSPLIACTQYRMSEMAPAYAELKSTQFITPFHAVSSMVLLELQLDVRDMTSNEMQGYWEVLRAAAMKYPIFDAAVTFYEGLTAVHEKRYDEADDRFRMTVEMCLGFGMSESFLSWRATARILMSPNNKVDATYAPADVQAMRDHITLANSRKLLASEITGLQFVVDTCKG
eukprot:TRINITY_DN5973_c0_g2_i1.p1 TRINITY_DN5973_c0_g2~~TRINITY_DN5973_c0_g2_i1.p1  ORF type:complete len:1481 (+),score=336.94 TRINITY_DN5973_c0_g2_i1:144-4586(+)